MSLSRPRLAMTAAAKRRFIRSLTKRVTSDLVAKVKQMPPEWDGNELRELIGDAFDCERNLSARTFYGDASGQQANKRRLRDYRDERLTRNL